MIISKGKRCAIITVSDEELSALRFAVSNTIVELQDRRQEGPMDLNKYHTEGDRRIRDHVSVLTSMSEQLYGT